MAARTKTVEGLLSEKPSCGSKKKMEELCEMMKKKHAKEYANLLQGYEEGRQRDLESENEANEEVEGKDQELKIKIEEILTLMREMHRGQTEKDEVKERKGEAHHMVHEVSHSSEREKMLQDYTEAGTEELTRKKNDLSEVREKNTMIETQRNKKKSEETQEDVEKIKKKKNKKDEDSRKHTEKDDGRKKRRVLKHAEKRGRSKEDRVERDEKKRRKLKAESVSPESISDTDL